MKARHANHNLPFHLLAFRLFFFCSKRKILLGEITKCHHNNGCKYFSDGRVNMNLLYKYFQEHIIKSNAGKHQQKITYKLHPAPQITGGKNHVAAQIKTKRKTEQERQQKGGNMWADCNVRNIGHFFFQNIVVTDKKNKDVERCIKSATGSVPERLQRHQSFKWRIKKIAYT